MKRKSPWCWEGASMSRRGSGTEKEWWQPTRERHHYQTLSLEFNCVRIRRMQPRQKRPWTLNSVHWTLLKRRALAQLSRLTSCWQPSWICWMTIGPGRQGKPSLWKLFVNQTKMISKQIFQGFYSIVENKICPFIPHLTNILRSNLRNAQQLHNCHKRKWDWGNDLKISKFKS